jgi:hypothetical protein
MELVKELNKYFAKKRRKLKYSYSAELNTKVFFTVVTQGVANLP